MIIKLVFPLHSITEQLIHNNYYNFGLYHPADAKLEIKLGALRRLTHTSSTSDACRFVCYTHSPLGGSNGTLRWLFIAR